MPPPLVAVASLLAPLLLGAAAAAAQAHREPPAPARFSIGVLAAAAEGPGVEQDSYATRVIGPRVGARVRGNSWVVAALGWGSIRYDNGSSEIDSSLWDGQVAFAYRACSKTRVTWCAVPSMGIGIQRGWIEYFDILAREDPWTENITRAYAEGRVAGSVLLGGHASLSLAIGVRPVVLGPEAGDVAVVLVAGIDVEI